MKTSLHTALFTLCILVLSGAQAIAADNNRQTLAHAEKLVQESCTQCHGDEIYTRKDRFIKSLDALGTQVRRCRDNVHATWFDEDTNAVIHYLNSKYYKF
jgi:mono/diheme cytochrome c family protein